jgi:hypothetical protein
VASTPFELRAMAADCRKLAVLATTETVRNELIEAAERFERLAEQRQRPKADGHSQQPFSE